MQDLRFPIGQFVMPGPLSKPQRDEALRTIELAPQRLREAVKGLTEAQLDTRYRPEGWTLRQVVHHLPDSHLNSYTRLKLALTEDVPTIRTYDEALWAELPDSAACIDLSLDLMDALHKRWVLLFHALSDVQWARTFRHPDLGEMRVDELLAFYAWHSDHHIAHMTSLREQQGW